ncbi:MAG: hypothetical protein Q4F02_02930 [Candidatus Saccharibacteria bacterium]|nr:hypothetical protein [Candidatus Saccharibacteria bacterium]
MKHDKTIDEMMTLLEEKLQWFHGEDFRLEEAKQRFVEARDLAAEIETRLNDMQHDIEVLSKDFAES